MFKIPKIKTASIAALSLAGLAAGVEGVKWYEGPDRERSTNNPHVTFKLKSFDLPHTEKADSVIDVVSSPDTAARLEMYFKESGSYIVNVDVMYSKKANWFSNAEWPGATTFIVEKVTPGDTRIHNVAGEFRGINIEKIPDNVKNVEEWYLKSHFVSGMPSR